MEVPWNQRPATGYQQRPTRFQYPYISCGCRELLSKELLEGETTAASRGDDEIHENHDCVVAPAVGAVFSPEACVPFEEFLLNGAEHHEDEPDRSKLSENTERHAQSSRALNHSQKKREAPAHFDVCAALLRIGNVFPTTGEESKANHQAHQ